MNNTKRIGWLDSAKGFAIILVVLGHMALGITTAGMFKESGVWLEALERFIYSFHMPLFWIVSGYTFYLAYCKNREERAYRYKNQLLNSIYVYFLFSTVQWTIQFVFSSVTNTKVSLADLLLMPIRPMSPYWFTFVLVFYYVVFYAFEKVKLPETAKLIIVAVLSALGNPLDIDIVIPLRILLVHMLLFYLGIYFAKVKAMIADSAWAMILLSVAAVTLIFVDTVFDIPYIPMVSDVLVPAAAGLFFFNLFYKLSYLNNSRFLCFMGKYSLEIYVTHCIITAGCRVILFKAGVQNCLVMLILGTVIATAVPLALAILLKKLRLHELFFRPTELFSKKNEKEHLR
ncbi:MAG: acyltransferase [Clostridia bacterium]|nr:acyltransferase [Clostridia bacterium]